MSSVIIYSTPSCSFCHKAKEYLKNKQISFTDFNVAEDHIRAEEMFTKSGQMGVPVLEINGEIVIGFDKEEIDRLLLLA